MFDENYVNNTSEKKYKTTLTQDEVILRARIYSFDDQDHTSTGDGPPDVSH